MAKRKKKSFSPLIIKSVVIIFIIVSSFALGLFMFQQISNVLTASDRFIVKTIVIDPSLQFIHKRDLIRLKGKNIFSIDLKDVEHKLLLKYPQISELKVQKKYPDQIHLVAKKRNSLAQFEFKKKYLVFDDEGVILAKSDKERKNLPSINGFKVPRKPINLGTRLDGSEINTAIRIIKSFNENATLSSYKVSRVDMDHLSKIFLHLDKDVKAIIDDQKVDYKIKVLGVVLTQGNLNLKDVKYIDLRFKEPIIGKK